eukprot:1403494-Rhodomonas_salina.1
MPLHFWLTLAMHFSWLFPTQNVMTHDGQHRDGQASPGAARQAPRLHARGRRRPEGIRPRRHLLGAHQDHGGLAPLGTARYLTRERYRARCGWVPSEVLWGPSTAPRRRGFARETKRGVRQPVRTTGMRLLRLERSMSSRPETEYKDPQSRYNRYPDCGFG